MYASPSNNYWLVGDQDPTTRWSSGSVAYVADNDATYLAWLAAGFETSEIATEQELADLLNATYPAGSPLPPPYVPITGTGPLSVTVINGAVGSATTGQYTVPAGVHHLQIFGQAAGGGGGGCSTATAQVGGPGGSGETRTITLAVNPGDQIDYTIGAAGAAAGAGAGSGGTAADLTVGAAASPVPSILATNANANTTGSTTLTVNLPAGITAGDFLLILIHNINSSVLTTPSGWTLLNHTAFASGNGDSSVYYKQAASGSEGASVNITASISTPWYAISYRIQGHEPTVAPLIANATGGSNKNGNPPSLNASAFGVVNKLWLALCTGFANLRGVPSGFQDGLSPAEPAAAVRGSWYGSNVNTVDPTSYTLSVNGFWATHTVAIRSLIPASVMVCKGGVGGGGASGGTNGSVGTTPTGSGGARVPTSDGGAQASGSIVTSQGGSNMFGVAPMRVAATFINGTDASGPGAGGTSGGNGSASGTARSGGAGGPGMVMVVGYG